MIGEFTMARRYRDQDSFVDRLDVRINSNQRKRFEMYCKRNKYTKGQVIRNLLEQILPPK